MTRTSPGEIECIWILKDGSGSIYGARAGNGVILVTTKTGADQAPTISFNTSYTLQGNTVTTRPADSFQRALYQNDIYMNGGGVESRKPYLEEELELIKKAPTPQVLNPDTQGAIIRKIAPQHSISSVTSRQIVAFLREYAERFSNLGGEH